MPANPTIFTADNIRLVRWLARDGLTQEEIAREMKISEVTLRRAKKRIPAVADALAIGKRTADYTVEDALIRRAMGYDLTETTLETRRNPDGTETRTEKTVAKHMAADVTAIIFWLKNRCHARWRDIKAVEMQDLTPAALTPGAALPDGFNPANLSDDEALRLFELFRKATLPPPSRKLAQFAAAPVTPAPQPPAEAVVTRATPPAPAKRPRGRPRKIAATIEGACVNDKVVV